MNNKFLPDEPRAPDLSVEAPPPRIEIKGVAAYIAAYASRKVEWKNHDLYYLHAFGSKAAMETIRGFGMEPQGTTIRVEVPATETGESDEVLTVKVSPSLRRGWKVYPTRQVHVPGGRAYTVYETVIQHGSVGFHHDQQGKCEWAPDHFILLARSEDELPGLSYEKLAARTKLPLYRRFAEPLWEALSGTVAVKPLNSHGVVAYEVEVPDAKLAEVVGRLGKEGALPSAREILGIPEPDRFADNVELYEEATFNPNPRVPVGAY